VMDENLNDLTLIRVVRTANETAYIVMDKNPNDLL